MWAEVTELDGQTLPVNLDAVEFFRPRPTRASQLWAPGANCIMRTESGAEVQIRETLAQVQAIVQKANAA